MLNSLNSFIQNHQLFDKTDKLGLAISGGKDSVALAYMLDALGYSFVLIHCNFSLRGEESEGDEEFVRQLSAKLKHCSEIFVAKFDTENYASEKSINIQLAARELRYSYFKELYLQNKFTKLLTAHHKTDLIETFFINLNRGSGIKGIKSIPLRRDYIVRPLMNFTSDDVVRFLKENSINFRSDSSNQTNKYLRNKIRNKVMPQLLMDLPLLDQSILKTTKILSEENELLNHFLNDLRTKICVINEKNIIVSICKSKLMSYPQTSTILYHLLDKYDFNYSQCEQIVESCKGESGKYFKSNTYEVLTDRDELILRSISVKPVTEIVIRGEGIFRIDNAQFSIKKWHGEVVFSSNPNEEIVSLNDHIFPLTLRYWNQGDFIHPLGMKGKKSLSDFFIDAKIPVFEKHKIPLLCKQNNVLWICGKRISDQIKTDKNNNLYKVNIIFDL